VVVAIAVFNYFGWWLTSKTTEAEIPWQVQPRIAVFSCCARLLYRATCHTCGTLRAGCAGLVTTGSVFVRMPKFAALLTGMGLSSGHHIQYLALAHTDDEARVSNQLAVDCIPPVGQDHFPRAGHISPTRVRPAGIRADAAIC
jgi:hypothetical protein